MFLSLLSKSDADKKTYRSAWYHTQRKHHEQWAGHLQVMRQILWAWRPGAQRFAPQHPLSFVYAGRSSEWTQKWQSSSLGLVLLVRHAARETDVLAAWRTSSMDLAALRQSRRAFKHSHDWLFESSSRFRSDRLIWLVWWRIRWLYWRFMRGGDVIQVQD